MLAIMDSILTPDAYTLVTRAVLNKVIQLEIKSFLNTENSGTLIENHGAGCFASILPHIVSIISSAVTDIERHNRECLYGSFTILAGKSQKRQ